MIIPTVEKLAEEVRAAIHPELPVNPLSVANAEGIKLAEGDFADEFCGRIEFHPSHGTFLLFYPSKGNPGRIKFSVAHELGHYFIESHRDLLLRGSAHDSESGFICSKEMERQADNFAAALLIPRSLVSRRMQPRGFLTLHDIQKVASDCQTSLTCAAFRYVQLAEEACAVVISKDGAIRFGIVSDELGAKGCKFIKKSGTPLDRTCPAAKISSGADLTTQSGKVSSTAWMATQYREFDMWEESLPLGYSGQVLTILSLEKS